VTARQLFGTDFAVWFGVIVVMCGCVHLMGRALAQSWRPARAAIPYALVLSAADRLLIYALFSGDLFSITGAIIDTYLILMTAVVSYHVTLAAQMVRQYPWLYERHLLVTWRQKNVGSDANPIAGD
jgi:small-conductance mechanosensitive channel